ncbi:MAG: four helix bundle protein [Gemmatimonadota bacterium]
MSYENLRAYQAAQQLRAEVDKLKKVLVAGFEDLFQHVDEAVDSIMNNLAEGNTSVYTGRRINYYDIAAGSTREVRGGLRSLDCRGAFNGASVFRAVVLTLSISKMIAALIAREAATLTPNNPRPKPNF